MGISTVVVMAILSLDVHWRIDLAPESGGQRLPLMIEIRRVEPVVEAPRPTEISPVEISPQIRTRLYDESVIAPVAPVEPVPTRDWEAIAKDFSEQHVVSLQQREEALASMWRKSPSVMFESQNEIGVVDVEQLMANFDFREPVGVAGVGFAVGSCFVGIPLVGVPVEERSVGIRLWYCR
jgi:hypothetical protein